jgi:hypothetical protein
MRRATSQVVLAVLVGAGVVRLARAQDTTIRVSNSPSGSAADAASWLSAVSGDGSTIAFSSTADDLVPNDVNLGDVFVYDQTTGTVSLVDVDSNGVQANGWSNYAVLSSDGRFVAFSSLATNLDYDPNGAAILDVFLHDRVLGATTRVSTDLFGIGADANCGVVSISGDGQKILFSSDATNLTTTPLPRYALELFLHDMATGTTTLVSTDAAGSPANQTCNGILSRDGSTLVFTTGATNLPNASPNYSNAVYAKDLSSGAVERIDLDSTNSFYAGWSAGFGVSSDGSLVLFDTDSAMVPQDDNGVPDAFLRDRSARTTELVSVGTGGSVTHTLLYGLHDCSMSSDGRFVAFTSDAVDVVDDDTNGVVDVFVHDRLTTVTTRASVADHDVQASGGETGIVSDGGETIAFSWFQADYAPNDTNQAFDVFARERTMTPATWTHYGTGFPGRHGTVPTITPDHSPWRGTTVDLDVSNSSGSYTVAFVLVGGPRNSIPTSLGGTLLLDEVEVFPIALAKSGGTFSAEVPTDWSVNGLVVDMQALELDPWAAYGVSFTDGLEAVLGDG